MSSTSTAVDPLHPAWRHLSLQKLSIYRIYTNLQLSELEPCIWSNASRIVAQWVDLQLRVLQLSCFRNYLQHCLLMLGVLTYKKNESTVNPLLISNTRNFSLLRRTTTSLESVAAGVSMETPVTSRITYELSSISCATSDSLKVLFSAWLPNCSFLLGKGGMAQRLAYHLLYWMSSRQIRVTRWSRNGWTLSTSLFSNRTPIFATNSLDFELLLITENYDWKKLKSFSPFTWK